MKRLQRGGEPKAAGGWVTSGGAQNSLKSLSPGNLGMGDPWMGQEHLMCKAVPPQSFFSWFRCFTSIARPRWEGRVPGPGFGSVGGWGSAISLLYLGMWKRVKEWREKGLPAQPRSCQRSQDVPPAHPRQLKSAQHPQHLHQEQPELPCLSPPQPGWALIAPVCLGKRKAGWKKQSLGWGGLSSSPQAHIPRGQGDGTA